MAGFLAIAASAFGSETPEQLADQVLAAYESNDVRMMQPLVYVNENTRNRHAVESLLENYPGGRRPYVRSAVVTREEFEESGNALDAVRLNAPIAGYIKMETDLIDGQSISAVFLAYGCIGKEYLLLTIAKD